MILVLLAAEETQPVFGVVGLHKPAGQRKEVRLGHNGVMNRPTLTIIGTGRMGSQFAEIFADGFDVRIVSSRDIPANAIESADYLFLAVPINALGSVIEQINPLVRSGARAFDMGSARVAAGKAMARLKCPWFGLHSGGAFGSPDPVVLDYLASRGHEFEPMREQAHDEANARVGLAHFIGMSIDSILSTEDRKILGTSPAASHLLRLIGHMRANSPATYYETQVLNQHMQDARTKMIDAFRECHDRLTAGQFPFS